jgi:nucleotide-binding universal stress UspA family protein
MKIKRILTGIDFGHSSEAVIAYSSYFAKKMEASLTMLYVIDYLITPPAYLSPYIEEEKKSAEEKLENLQGKLKDSGIKTRAEVIVGRLHESFDAAIKKLYPDMIALGFATHTLRRSSSEKLIKGLAMPMLVVRGEKSEKANINSVKIRNILCPVDFSEMSSKALNLAKEVGDIFSAKVHILYVLPDHLIRKKMEEFKKEDIELKDLLEDTKTNLLKYLDKYNIKNEADIKEGEPGKVIVSFAKEYDIDLIVMGARGLGLIKGMLIGSITDAVLKSSTCPVFVIH